MSMNDRLNLRIDLENVGLHVIHSFSESMDEIKAFAKDAITASMNQLRQGGLKTAIVESVERTMSHCIDEKIKEAVESAVAEYFESGEGSAFITSAILEHLESKKAKK